MLVSPIIWCSGVGMCNVWGFFFNVEKLKVESKFIINA